MYVEQLDHLVLTVEDIDTTCSFYSRIRGMKVVESAGGRKALSFGSQKIDLHQRGSEFKPHAKNLTPGSADLCLLTSMPVNDVIDYFLEQHVKIIEGPVRRTEATGDLISVYLRDPDGNLLEIAHPFSNSNAK